MKYIVLDFEATCDEPLNPYPQEIIEFPAILVDSDTRQVVSEFHTYVRPVVHPQLTPFCVELTGITQNRLEGCPVFPEVLSRFGKWLAAEAGNDFLLATCGDWDLGSLLPRQCRQHSLMVPHWADKWANLRWIFALHYPHAAHQTRSSEMVAQPGLEWFWRPHSGIDDSGNIAQVLRKMLDAEIAVGSTAFWRCLGCGQENLHRS